MESSGGKFQAKSLCCARRERCPHNIRSIRSDSHRSPKRWHTGASETGVATDRMGICSNEQTYPRNPPTREPAEDDEDDDADDGDERCHRVNRSIDARMLCRNRCSACAVCMYRLHLDSCPVGVCRTGIAPTTSSEFGENSGREEKNDERRLFFSPRAIVRLATLISFVDTIAKIIEALL
jgi:hypothetical protein